MSLPRDVRTRESGPRAQGFDSTYVNVTFAFVEEAYH